MACGDITSLALTPHAVFTSFREGGGAGSEILVRGSKCPLNEALALNPTPVRIVFISHMDEVWGQD